MRLLYAGRAPTGHDARFLAAWREAGMDVATFWTTGAGDLPAALREFGPDVVQAGPLPDVAYAVAAAWDGPLVAASWGFDLMRDVREDEAARDRAAHVLARAEVILVDNDGPHREALALGAPRERVVQFPWGVELEVFTPGASPLPDRLGWAGRRIVVCTRRHEDVYGVDILLDAFAMAAAGDTDLRLVLAGAGSRTAAYRDFVAGAGLGKRVALLGELDEAGLVEAYRAADLYVSPSWVDGTSVSLLEAMACGAPVCVSAIEGNAQWVTPVTGASFPPGDAAALAARLTEPDGGRAGAALELVRERADWARTRKLLPELADLALARSRA